jgi:hypothetical protein
MVGLGGLEPPTSPLSGAFDRARDESGSHPAVLEHWPNNFTQMRANRMENQSMRVIGVGGGSENRCHVECRFGLLMTRMKAASAAYNAEGQSVGPTRS